MAVKIPGSYGALRPFTLAGETEMSEADKARIGKIYSAKDWRALARGGSKQWYAVSDMASETAAADAVLNACHASERDCTLWAVSNFRVADKR